MTEQERLACCGPSCRIGLDLGTGLATRELALSLACPPEDPARRVLGASREEGSRQNPAMPTPWSQLSASRIRRNTFLFFRLHAWSATIVVLWQQNQVRPVQCPFNVFHFLSPFSHTSLFRPCISYILIVSFRIWFSPFISACIPAYSRLELFW